MPLTAKTPQPAPKRNWLLISTTALATTLFVISLGWFSGYIALNRQPSARPAAFVAMQDDADKRIKGNKNSRIYHLSHCPNYGDISEQNIIWFKTEDEAKLAGFRMARNC